MSRSLVRNGFTVAIVGLSVFVVGNELAYSKAGKTKTKAPTQAKEKSETIWISTKATSKDLGGKERFLTLVSTDKPIYKSGETIYVRGVVLNAANHKPLPAERQAHAQIEIKDPKGVIVAKGAANSKDSVWGYSWKVPDGQAGGQYTAKVHYPWQGHAPAERKFDIRAYRTPRLKSQITFLRDGYGPGEKVTATLEVKRAEGGVPDGAKVSVNARVDGKEIKGGTARVDSNGNCTVSFNLPGEIPRGEGTLALVIEDGGVIETASKTIPILLQTVDLKIYPEGGNLVAGFKNRVYIQANQPNGKPADLVGKLISKYSNEVIKEFRTVHEGRGRFQFKPEKDKEYFLKITEPAGIKTVYALPKVTSEGAVVSTSKDIFKKDEPITVMVGTDESSCRVTLSKREIELASKKIENSNGTLKTVEFNPPENIDGVLTVTVWNYAKAPLAERLVFREPSKSVKISIKPEKNSYVPGDRAKVKVKATDSNGKPVSTVVCLTVTDDSVLEMIEKREQAPQLPVMLFLESEVTDLADAHIYLDPKNPKAPLATDLLLGTQGWRRFALMNFEEFVKHNGDDAKRVVALKRTARSDWFRNRRGFVLGKGGVIDGVRAVKAQGLVPPPPPGMLPPPPVPAFKSAKQEVAKEDKKPARKPHRQIAEKAKPKVASFSHDWAAPQQRQVAVLNKKANKNAFGRRVFKPAALHRGPRGGAAGMGLKVADDLAHLPLPGALPPPPVHDARNMAIGRVWVREFAHKVRKNRKPTDRVDFTETLFWNAGVKTNPDTGEATINFGLNDSVTTFKVFADAFSNNGAVGAAQAELKSVQPFYTAAKMPLEVTAGDKILLPISLVNATENKLASADISIDTKGELKLNALQKADTGIGAGERVRWIQPIQVGFDKGQKEIVLKANAGVFQDKLVRSLAVKPQGFPVEKTFGGILKPGQSVAHTITLPGDTIEASVSSCTSVYLSPLANLTAALERMIQDPYGCFEQTSSTSYPLTMAQQYFLTHPDVDPKLVNRSKSKLDKGYKKLVSFWCPDRGYEWFGQNPGHEALTAFGLLHFTDMAQVREVDKNMIATTRSWLMKQKDGKGGFTRKRRSLHSWIEDKDCSNAYIVWALLESGQPASQLKAELASLKKAANASQNNYVVALAANALYLADQKLEAKQLMDRLAAKQAKDGSINGIKSSIVGSGGKSLKVEGTALATLAWLRDQSYAGSVEKSIKYLADSCESGRYGSTQATVLALRAIVDYDKQRARTVVPGKVMVFVDGQSIGDWATFNKKTKGAVNLPDISELMTPGTHKLELKLEGGNPIPYSMAVKYNSVKPQSAEKCKLKISVKMAQDKVVEGNSTEANVTVINSSDEVVPAPVAIVGLPGGLEPRHDQLKELLKKGIFDAYEVKGRDVVLYWRALPKNAKVEVPLSVIASVPGTYTGPASRAYLYYTDEHKQWIDGLKVNIEPKNPAIAEKDHSSNQKKNEVSFLDYMQNILSFQKP